MPTLVNFIHPQTHRKLKGFYKAIWILISVFRYLMREQTNDQGHLEKVQSASVEESAIHHHKREPDHPTPSSHSSCNILFLAALIIIIAAYLLLKNSVFVHSLLLENILIVFASAISAVFCAANLIWGVREKQTWFRGVASYISQRKSPYNYWTAIALWAFFTFGSLLCLIVKAKSFFHE